MTECPQTYNLPSSDFRPKKSLGQHFLVDKNILRKIISACHLTRSDIILEIGPGTGVLTREIAPCVRRVIAVDSDSNLCRHLKKEFSGRNVDIIHSNILRYDFASLPKNIKVIGNLPYYISSPILERIIQHRRHFDSVFITVQYEFGKRMVANADTKDYSALTLFVGYYTDPKILFKIKNTSFKPAPKVHSCFIKLDIRKNFRYKAEDESLLWNVVRCTFQQRRKTILNSLSRLIEKERLRPMLDSLKINPQQRAENLTLKDFVSIANAVYKSGIVTP